MQKEWARLLDPRSIPTKIGFASIVCFYSCYSFPKEPEHVKYMVQKIRPRSFGATSISYRDQEGKQVQRSQYECRDEMAGPATAQRYTLRIVGKLVVLRVLNLKDKVALNEGPLPAKWNYIAKLRLELRCCHQCLLVFPTCTRGSVHNSFTPW